MTTPIDVDYPFTGDWLVQNSPADRVPSHGTELFASSYAIDFVPVVGGRSAPFTVRSLFRPEEAERFPGFGRSVLAPANAIVLATHDQEPDHAAYRGIPSIGYALTQRSRIAQGWQALAGNHVILQSGPIYIALCHLQRASILVRPGQHMRSGDQIGRCGNSGNSTEPHLHVQAFDNPNVELAHPVALTFNGSIPHNGEIVHSQLHE